MQGSRKVPYAVRIEVKPLRAAQWRRVADNNVKTPRFLAMLLNGEIPEDIEDAFQAAHCTLFPQSIADVSTECSCPDWSNPCKHVAAVYYLIGEEFDRDPFLLFALRGLERDAMLPALALEERREQTVAQSAPTPRPPLERPPVDAWLLRRTGRFPFWHGNVPLEDALSAVYAAAGERAATLLAETWPDCE
ncbi:MAG: SWIM zinc finger family protein [Candidatus Eremiobacteraeota bacterium]|nr:SWIM zinc finger family protein [Candidatus Eremiobacteraeota bacterium]